MSSRGRRRSVAAGGPARRLLRALYWLAVVAVAVVLALALIYFLETRDPSQVGP